MVDDRSTGCVGATGVRSRQLIGALAWVWYTWIAVFLVQVILSSAVGPTTHLSGVPFVLTHASAATAILALKIKGGTAAWLVAALWVRLAFLALNVTSSIDSPFIGREGDTERFFETAVFISSDLSAATDAYGGLYTALLGYLFHLVGPSVVTAQYLNVTFGLSAVILLVVLLTLLEVSRRIERITVAVAALMPMVVVHSSVLRREAIIQAFVTASAAFFFYGFLRRKYSAVFAAFLCVLGASAFHAGTAVIMLAYILILAILQPIDGQLTFGSRGALPSALFTIAAIFVLVQFPDLFLGKLDRYDSADALLETTNRRAGGSPYLTGLEVSSLGTFIAYAPVRAVYFIASPLPWDWRGLTDLLTFALDSAIYTMALYIAFRPSSLRSKQRGIIVAFLLVLVFVFLTYGAGVSNSGTALRHRSTFVMITLAASAFAYDQRIRARLSSRCARHGASIQG